MRRRSTGFGARSGQSCLSCTSPTYGCADWEARSVSTSTSWQYPGLWFLTPSHVDEFSSKYLGASTTLRIGCDCNSIHRQDGAPTTNRYTDSRFDGRRSGVLRARPGHLCRLRPGDSHSRVLAGVKLLRSTASTSLHPPSRLGDHISIYPSIYSYIKRRQNATKKHG